MIPRGYLWSISSKKTIQLCIINIIFIVNPLSSKLTYPEYILITWHFQLDLKNHVNQHLTALLRPIVSLPAFLHSLYLC